jgi:hypothetical protein
MKYYNKLLKETIKKKKLKELAKKLAAEEISGKEYDRLYEEIYKK